MFTLILVHYNENQNRTEESICENEDISFLENFAKQFNEPKKIRKLELFTYNKETPKGHMINKEAKDHFWLTYKE